MALRIVHNFVSPLPDSDNSEEVRPSNWNEDHVIEGVTAFSETLLALDDANEWTAALGINIGTDIQAYDALLAAIAGLTMVADRYIYGTGADTVALGTITSFGRSILDDADAAAVRSTIGAIIGTDVQAYDAELAAIAGLTSAADKGIMFTGAGTAATYDLSTFARTILDDANGPAVQTTIGISAFAQTILDDADAAAVRTTIGLVIGTDVQAYDAELAALAGLTSAANKMPYFTGSGTAGLLDFKDEDDMVSDSATAVPSQQSVKAFVDAAVAAGVSDGDKGDIVVSGGGLVWEFDTGVVTAFSKTVLDDANAGAWRTTLGLVIGTDVQAYDAELAAIAGLTSAANKGITFTGSGTAATYDLSAFALTILDDANAGAVRTTLGVAIGTDVQAYDAELAALAGLTSAADKLPYFTGAGTADVADFTAGGRALVNSAGTANTVPYFSASNTVTLGAISAFGLSLIDDAAATNARTTMGLVIGTDVQAYDAELAQIAGLSDPNADRILFWDDSAGTYAFLAPDSTITISGTTLSATQASTSQVGASEWATTAEFWANTASRVLETNQLWAAGAEVTLTDATTIAVDFSTFINGVVTLGGNRAMGNPSNEKVGQSGVIRIVQDGTGNRTLSYGTDWEFAGGSAPVLSTTAADQDLLFYYIIATNRVFASLVKDIS